MVKPIHMKDCPVCPNQFVQKGRRAYCSDECKAKGKASHRKAQLADMRARAKVCREIRKDPNYIDPKWLVRGDISNSNRSTMTGA